MITVTLSLYSDRVDKNAVNVGSPSLPKLYHYIWINLTLSLYSDRFDVVITSNLSLYSDPVNVLSAAPSLYSDAVDVVSLTLHQLNHYIVIILTLSVYSVKVDVVIT